MTKQEKTPVEMREFFLSGKFSDVQKYSDINNGSSGQVVVA